MDACIDDRETARHLARATVRAIARFHRNEAEEGVVEDRLFQSLAQVIEKGRQEFEARVHPNLRHRGLYEKALVDHLLRPFGRIKSRIW